MMNDVSNQLNNLNRVEAAITGIDLEQARGGDTFIKPIETQSSPLQGPVYRQSGFGAKWRLSCVVNILCVYYI